MFYYSLHGYEENTIIQHQVNFTQGEFEDMCKEAPLFHMCNYDSYDSNAIYDYLIEKYKFEPLKTTAGFFVDGEVDIEEGD